LAHVRFDDTDDLIDICYDNVFKAVFTRGTPESRGSVRGHYQRQRAAH
jgi:hypothetical protein